MPDVLAQDELLAPAATTPFTESFIPASAAPPSREGSVAVQPRIDAAMRASAEAVEQAKKSMAQEESGLVSRQQDLAPLRKQMLEQAMKPIPAPPKSEQAPKIPQQADQKGSEDWVFAASLLGALAGAFTRNHATNALAAFSGAMQGYAEGSHQKYEQNMKTWEAENKRVLENNNAALNDYKEILSNRKQTIEQMSIALQVAGAEHDDQAMITAAKTKNSLTIAQLYDKQAQALEQYGTKADQISLQNQNYQLKVRQQEFREHVQQLGLNPTDQSGIEHLIDQIGRYEIALPPAPRNKTGTNPIRNAVLAKYPDYSENQFKVVQMQKTADAKRMVAQATAEGRTSGAAGANIELVMRSVKPVLENAADAAQEVPATTFKRLNQIMQMAAEEIGDPALRNFKLANEELAMTIARVMNPRSSQITVNAAQHARELITTADSPEAYDKLLLNVKRIAEREFGAVQDQLNRAPLAPIEVSTGRKSQSIPGALENIGGKVGGAVEGGVQSAPPGGAMERYEKEYKEAHPPQIPGSGLMDQFGKSYESIHPHLPEGWTLTPQ